MILKIILIGKKLNNLVIYCLILILRFYQYLISPFFSKSCRYFPTCSQYSIEALNKHGVLKGALLTIIRLMKCNPFFVPKFDPVPPKKNNKNLS